MVDVNAADRLKQNDSDQKTAYGALNWLLMMRSTGKITANPLKEAMRPESKHVFSQRRLAESATPLYPSRGEMGSHRYVKTWGRHALFTHTHARTTRT